MSSIKTKFVDYKQGPPQNLFVNQRQLKYDSNSYLMKIKAVGINRAQCLHRVGRYPINNQVQKYIGLQAAGQVINHQTGQKLFDGMALLSGGSYSQYAVIPKTHVMKTPKGLNFVESSAIPQAWLTAFLLIRLAQLQKGSTVVIYAGASGVGTAAIQICRVLGLIPFAVVSNQAKGKVTIQCGVQNVVYYKQNQNWAKQLLQKNNNKGFNAVLDCIGPSNADKTLQLLGIDGKWIFYGTLSGIKGQLNYAQLIGKRISLISSTLKTRSKQYKDKLIQQFLQKILPSFQNKKVKPVIGQKLQCNWQSAQSFIKAHQIMQSNANSDFDDNQFTTNQKIVIGLVAWRGRRHMTQKLKCGGSIEQQQNTKAKQKQEDKKCYIQMYGDHRQWIQQFLVYMGICTAQNIRKLGKVNG